ncbi:MAG: PSD1 and planctomycete cytochrome C domain-containing protein [Pirellulaceae bacterium]
MVMLNGFLAVLLLAALANLAQADAPLPEKVDFNRDVRPILADNCFFCHGPDPNHREADLRLDVREEALESAALVPGEPAESALIERILADDPEERMPPADSRKELTERQKEILKLWIEQGAEYQRHWAYEPPVKADVNLAAGHNGVDLLVGRRLAEIGLKPSAEADRRTLIRRLSWDLIGLPPTPEEVLAFENDASPMAYENLVDRLLQNPHYGERMAIAWLDVVRFADTIGYHSDNPRNVWPYRDWVIKCFNDNKPFDRFTIEQIAGDLLPDASQETRVGSAFNRLLLTTEEGGAQAKDYEARMVADRVRAIGTAWLGQTTGCAQCHDHKFDPFTARDFYSLGAFFADIEEPILGRREDGMTVLTPEQELRLAALDAARAEAASGFDAIVPQLDAAQQQWEADIVAYDVTLPELRPESQASDAAKQAARQVIDIVKSPSRTAEQQQVVQAFFRGTVTRLFAAQREAVAKAERERREYYDSLPKCLVSVSTPNKRIVRILPRGNWMDESGEVVKPALPHYLPQPATEGRELTRLDLARWLVSRDNPLTPRTTMNRLWKHFFGGGLSKTLDDLGAQGEPPANPALLDWLACEFMDSGWDMKHMVRTIVTSATYRQVSTATPDLMAADPYNREYARQSAFRLDAELIRDTALAASGLLVPSIGGPSVKPYQPDGYWENLNFPTRDYVPDTGDSQYRRGLYVWWQRSFLHPSVLAFDAPSREECTAERARSNIPQQALVLLNDPTYVEAARSLAARVLDECNGAPEERLVRAWQLALQRNPRQDEVKTMLELLDLHRGVYRADPKAAEELLKVGFAPAPADMDNVELAAWTHVARVLLNLHEAITRS